MWSNRIKIKQAKGQRTRVGSKVAWSCKQRRKKRRNTREQKGKKSQRQEVEVKASGNRKRTLEAAGMITDGGEYGSRHGSAHKARDTGRKGNRTIRRYALVLMRRTGLLRLARGSLRRSLRRTVAIVFLEIGVGIVIVVWQAFFFVHRHSRAA